MGMLVGLGLGPRERCRFLSPSYQLFLYLRLVPDSILQSAYKAHLQAMRAQRRLEREEERRRVRSPTVSSDEESSAEENSGNEKQQGK